MKQVDVEEYIKKTIEKDIGEQVRITRLSKKKTRKQMSERIGISPTQIWKYEFGIDRISVSRLKEIANFLKVDIVDLLPPSIMTK
jgi:transcriptional regulator with XRE-family HTH domain